MRAVVTRVTSASVHVEEQLVAAIGRGLLVLVGVAADDVGNDAVVLGRKIEGLRIFADEMGAMNRSVTDVGGAVLLVSQFTLLGDARHGRRPSFIAAAQPTVGRKLYERLAAELIAAGVPLQTGTFGASMAVASVNDGPVTILLDTGKVF
ncbi:MAG: D-tyrosyl-tRNA(Tyr) deacylase [Candidatus Eremiobacteraeota bacterium]|nr:D-tyrosyl-tRNA(Tyr) deacylase [Candidatus Eremiobacteraeota bacterium]MBC5801932.1 D-tyrosyl-tRNA(Tyr) deacylase [Candidatus Eremiobacteraeota bacterium]MBC5821657.1 D-tyrosyl-tRNA(Tyr) deacylase [Candidatus Eremiobacteraeota bacterium]